MRIIGKINRDKKMFNCWMIYDNFIIYLFIVSIHFIINLRHLPTREFII